MEVQRIVESALRRVRKPVVPAGLKSPPELSGGLPLIGHTVEFVNGTIDLLYRANRELGEIAAFNILNRRMVAMFGPEAHEAVFRAPDAQLNPSEAYKIMTPVFGKDIVYDASPEKMAEQLKMLLPALKDKRMRTYGEAVVKEVEDTTRSWGEAGSVDFVEFCRVLTNFTSSRTLLGKEFREGMNEEFARVYHDLEQGVTPLAYLNANLPIPSFMKRDKARVRMVEMISKIIQARRKSNTEGQDFLQTLMEARYTDGRALTEHEITGLLLAGMFAGHHTSSVTTAWGLIELLRNRHELNRVVEEIDRVFANQPVSHAALRELTVTENVVKEALRLHPPLFMLVRVCVKDFIYKDYFIPAGTWIVVSPTVAHRIPEVFADPDRFDPDRFAPPREEDKRDFAYIAFGGGRHKCLGNAFAILQIKAILAMLLGQYEFDLAGDQIADDFHGLVIGPKTPCRVRYRKRANPSITIAGGEELRKIATQTAADAAAQAGCPVDHTTQAQVAAGAAKCPVDHTAMAAAAGAEAKNSDGKAGKAKAPKSKPPTDAPSTDTPVEPKPVRLSIRLDTDLCQGHAMCVGECPEVFEIGENGKVRAKTYNPPVELNDKVRAAEKFCPTRTIRLREIEIK